MQNGCVALLVRGSGSLHVSQQVQEYAAAAVLLCTSMA